MKRKKLKSYVLPSLLMMLIAGTILLTAITTSLNKNNEEDTSTYVSRIILEPDVAVINDSRKVINPYTDSSVTIGKSYYDYKADAKDQEKSIIYHDNTYMQNSGIDFVNKNTFDVVSVLDGTVTDVKEDETLGKIVEIKHDNDYISIYQSLSEVNVKKGDKVTQGQVLGKSGNNELDKEMGNHLHFEFYVNGQVVNPSLYLDKELKSDKTKE
ncbi:MAG: peptidoglycan DD-metalloendopeptidase family protein [Bacilli bacterium]|nr:peptidoglycan DD-metalloendopeptidase family protein [Bacilli bacterium]